MNNKDKHTYNGSQNNHLWNSHTFEHDGINSRQMLLSLLKVCFEVEWLRLSLCPLRPEIGVLSEQSMFWE